jgi:hypothetical protein
MYDAHAVRLKFSLATMASSMGRFELQFFLISIRCIYTFIQMRVCICNNDITYNIYIYIYIYECVTHALGLLHGWLLLLLLLLLFSILSSCCLPLLSPCWQVPPGSRSRNWSRTCASSDPSPPPAVSPPRQEATLSHGYLISTNIHVDIIILAYTCRHTLFTSIRLRRLPSHPPGKTLHIYNILYIILFINVIRSRHNKSKQSAFK